ncbi:MAG TPA: hypothetical protein EYP10_06395, partial [Armatimonadetes bacterium]|nr:hypothetical protein [Armatimonadota bacterium]
MRRIERLFIQSPREIVLAGLFSALGVLLPILFHIVGLGKTFLPMHLPILTLGFLASPATVAAAG